MYEWKFVSRQFWLNIKVLKIDKESTYLRNEESSLHELSKILNLASDKSTNSTQIIEQSIMNHIWSCSEIACPCKGHLVSIIGSESNNIQEETLF